VHFAGVVVDRPVLSIEHPGGLISSYEPVETSLVGGESVAGGDTIGTVVSGHCSALCLHFGVRLNGDYVSPMRFLGGIPWSVLIPTRG
jgi:murein DD-endopeptidase MepM/ murein hydrolase activator NlpD